MRRLYVVTHPEATHHVDGLVGGWYDSRLTGRGRERAAEIAEYLRRVAPRDAHVGLRTSDLRRCRETAEVLGACLGAEVVADAGLREKSYGVAGGRPQEWLVARFVPPPAEGERLDHDEGIAGGETKRRWIGRVYAAVARIEAAGAEHQVVVTHGGAVSWVITAWMRIPVEVCTHAAFRVPAGSVTVLGEDDHFHNRTLIALGVTDLGR